MPRNGSGTYSSPVNSWNPQINGALATGPDFNSQLVDIANALTQSVSADGQTPIAGNINMNGNKLTNLAPGSNAGDSLRWQQLFSQGIEIDVTSAATTDVGVQNTCFLRITGTTTITSFGTNYNGPRFLRMAGALTLTNSATLICPDGADLLTAAGDILVVMPKATTGTPDGWYVARYISASSIQAQRYTAFASTGTAPAYVLTPTPAITAYSIYQRFNVNFHAAGTAGSNTLNVSGLGAKNLKQYDTLGVKQPAIISANFISDVIYDGTDFIVLSPAFSYAIVQTRRQTILDGPVDTNGFSAFGGSTGSTVVTASGVLTATAANALLNRTGQITNPSWTGLNVNGTMYLDLIVNSDGTCTTQTRTLAPNTRWGGADVVTNGQFTFNIQQMIGKVGNGSLAVQTYEVPVGEVTVAGGVVTAITWYSLRGQTVIRDAGVPSSTVLQKTHALGMVPLSWNVVLECQSADVGYAVGDQVPVTSFSSSAQTVAIAVRVSRSYVSVIANTAGFTIPNATTGSSTAYTAANWDTIFYLDRGWN